MAYDEGLAERVRECLEGEEGIVEKRMFGGLAFMVNGNMSVGITDERLMIRIDKDEYDELLACPHVHEMDFTGKPLRGFLYVDGDGVEQEEDLNAWVQKSLSYARLLPAK